MNWFLLEKNKCPKCRGDLALAERVNTTTGPGLKCVKPVSPNILCGFTISDAKFSAIVAGNISKKLLYEDAEVLEESFL